MVTSSAQNRSLQLGGKLVNDLTLYDGYAPGFGGQLVYRMKKHAGIETGIFYKIHRREFIYRTMNSGYTIDVNEHAIQIPLLYRFDSRLLNFSAGVNMSYFVGWRQTSGDPPLKINTYHSDPEFDARVGVSRSINIAPGFIVEPEAAFYLDVVNDDGGICLNISFRKLLF
jgi:hypothetical protein